MCYKKKPKFEDYKNLLEANQPQNKIIYLEKNEIDLDKFKTKS